MPRTRTNPILSPVVKRLLVTLLVVLALPAAADGARLDRGDGTFATKDARGLVSVAGRGALFGQIDAGALTVTDTNRSDGASVQVFGLTDGVTVDGNTTIYRCETLRCSGLRFRSVNGAYRVVAVGRGIDISAIGVGHVRVVGSDGTFSTDGAVFQPLVSAPFTGAFGG
jgi:hypothetical protein